MARELRARLRAASKIVRVRCAATRRTTRRSAATRGSPRPRVRSPRRRPRNARRRPRRRSRRRGPSPAPPRTGGAPPPRRSSSRRCGGGPRFAAPTQSQDDRSRLGAATNRLCGEMPTRRSRSTASKDAPRPRGAREAAPTRRRCSRCGLEHAQLLTQAVARTPHEGLGICSGPQRDLRGTVARPWGPGAVPASWASRRSRRRPGAVPAPVPGVPGVPGVLGAVPGSSRGRPGAVPGRPGAGPGRRSGAVPAVPAGSWGRPTRVLPGPTRVPGGPARQSRRSRPSSGRQPAAGPLGRAAHSSTTASRGARAAPSRAFCPGVSDTIAAPRGPRGAPGAP